MRMEQARTLLAIRVLLVTALLALPPPATAQVDSPPPSGGADKPIPSAALDSPAQGAVRQISQSGEDARPLPRRLAEAAKLHPDLVARLEEIRIYGRNEPEDFVGRKLSPLMQMRAQLERDVPLSPAKKVQRALCLIGLCANYGPEGIPLGDSPEVRAEARLLQTTTQLNAQFRGTLQ